MEALVSGMNGSLRSLTVTGPLGEPVTASYGIVDTETADGEKLAVLEMSAAAGITLVPQEKRNPLFTTTYGVGELIRDALDQGCRRFLIGIGGSATNDGGIGMLEALGFGFLDAAGKPVRRGAAGLEELREIRTEGALKQLSDCEFRIACDVTNPLCGEQGCSAVYGPQKGADPDMIKNMDAWLGRYAALAAQTLGDADPEYPGTGAAGGLGFAFRSFLKGDLQSGIGIVLEETRLEETLRTADLVVTGEGRLDGQTAMGKAPVGVAALAKKYGKPVVAFAGSVTRDAIACHEKGIDAFFPILRGICTLEEAMEPETARQNLADTAEQVYRLWTAR